MSASTKPYSAAIEREVKLILAKYGLKNAYIDSLSNRKINPDFMDKFSFERLDSIFSHNNSIEHGNEDIFHSKLIFSIPDLPVDLSYDRSLEENHPNQPPQDMVAGKRDAFDSRCGLSTDLEWSPSKSFDNYEHLYEKNFDTKPLKKEPKWSLENYEYEESGNDDKVSKAKFSPKNQSESRTLNQFFEGPDFVVPRQIKNMQLRLPNLPVTVIAEHESNIETDTGDVPKSATSKESNEVNFSSAQTEMDMNDLELLEGKLADLESENLLLSENLQELKYLEDKLAIANEKLAQSDRQRAMDSETFEAMKSNYETDLKALKKICQLEHVSKITEHQDAIKKLGLENKTLKQQISDLTQEVSKLRNELERQKRENEETLKTEREKFEREKQLREEVEKRVEALNEDKKSWEETSVERQEKDRKDSKVKFQLPNEYENEGKSDDDDDDNEEEKARLRKINGDWNSQIKGARRYKDLPEKERFELTKFEALPSAKNKNKYGKITGTSPTDSGPSLEQKQRAMNDSKLNEATDFEIPNITPTAHGSSPLGEMGAERRKEKEEMMRKKHEKQLADLQEYYESELAEMQKKLANSPQNQNQMSWPTDDRERDALVEQQQNELKLAKERAQLLGSQVPKYQSNHQVPRDYERPSSFGTPGYTNQLSPAYPGNAQDRNPYSPERSIDESRESRNGTLSFSQHMMKYSHLSIEELKQLRDQMKKELVELNTKLQHLPPGGHLTVHDKRERRQWSEHVEELEKEINFISKLLRKLEKPKY